MRFFVKVTCLATAMFFIFFMTFKADTANADEVCTIPKGAMVGNNLELMKLAGFLIVKENRGEPISDFEISLAKKIIDAGFIWNTTSELRDVTVTEPEPDILKFTFEGKPAFVFRPLVECGEPNK